MGIAIGATAVAIIYSPWGKRSGAHLNPALTLTFTGLGKLYAWDAAFYVIAQFLGGLAGVCLALSIYGDLFAKPPINYITTVPGPTGAWVAFLAETVSAFFFMLMVLYSTNSRRFAHHTGIFAGLLLALYVTLVSPYSGMSTNPARSFALALPSGIWMGIWIYFTAPFLGMALAALVYRSRKQPVKCGKLEHPPHPTRCIFKDCAYMRQTMAGEQILDEPFNDRDSKGHAA